MANTQEDNDDYRTILTTIDILSRFGCARLLKSKQGQEVDEAMEDIFQTSKRIPTRIQTDLIAKRVL